MSKWYGSLQNRLEENRQFCDEITVGTGVTEFFYSDRHPYEVIEVKDQRHVTIRAMGHRHIGDGCMDNNWELISDPEGHVRHLVKRGQYWYEEITATADLLDETDPVKALNIGLFFCNWNIDRDELRRRGTVKRYHRVNVSFGYAEYHYDYEF